MSNKLEKIAIFQTSDLALASALICWGFPLTDINKTDIKKALFIFHESDQLDQAVSSYWNDTLSVLPRKYFYSLKELKARLYA